jgi:HEAT repeat protein
VKKRLLVLLTVTGFCVIVGILISRSNSRNLVYQGKTVKAWLLQLSAPTDPKAHAEAEAAFQALGTNAVTELARLLRADDARWRKLAWSHTGGLPRRVRGQILQRVNSPNAYLIHPTAARLLGKLGPGAAAAEPELVRALQDKVNGTCWEAGGALGRIGKPAVPDLMHALQDGDTLVRCAAAYGLGEAGLAAAPAVPALMQMLMQGISNEQQIAAQSLAKIGAPAVAPLIEVLVREQGAASEIAASTLLRHYHFPTLGWPARENLPGDEAATAARQQAIHRLGASGVAEEVVVKVLTGAAVKDPAPGVRLAALKALAQGNRDVHSALPGLVACLRDESPPVREWSARTLRTIGPLAKPAIPALTRAAQDKEESVRAAAQEALETIRAGGTTNIPVPAPPK